MENKNLSWFDNVEIRPHPWPGLNWMTAILQVPDVKKARDLYIEVFQLVPIFDLPDPKNEKEFITTRLRYRGSNILLAKEGLDYDGKAPAANLSQPSIVFYLYVDNVDEVYQRALKNGMKSLAEPKETFWGDYRARLQCPMGYIWDIALRLV